MESKLSKSSPSIAGLIETKEKFNSNNKWFRTDFMCIDGHSMWKRRE